MTATQDMIVPSFEDETASGRKLAIICSKGTLDMAYPGLILGNAALGEGVELHLFFTFWGFDMIIKSRMNDLKFSPSGNTAMHMPIGDVRIPQALAPMPGMQPMATHMLKKQIADLEPLRTQSFQLNYTKAEEILAAEMPIIPIYHYAKPGVQSNLTQSRQEGAQEAAVIHRFI